MENIEKIILLKPLFSKAELEMLKNLRNSPKKAHLIINKVKENSIEDIKQWLKTKNKEPKVQGVFMVYFDNKKNKSPIGYVSYFIENNYNKVAKLGICLTKNSQGQGFGRISIKLLLDKLKTNLNIKHFSYSSLSSNKPSINLFNSLGFKETNILENNFYSFGKWHDVVEGELVLNSEI